MFAGKKILTIDDALSIRTFLRISLESQGVEFYEAGTAKEGLMLCQDVHPDLVVLDIGLPDVSGLEILPQIKRGFGDKPGNSVPCVIMLTVRKENEIIDEAKKLGADAYVTKPFLVDELMEAIEAAILTLKNR